MQENDLQMDKKMKHIPKVSVIIPIYKVEPYIERCARSLFEQTLDEIEYIFVNDCTPDKSIEMLEGILEEYPHRKHQVRFLHHDKNKGLTSTRNTGLAVATGEYIAHCDSDDWVEPNMYETLYNKAKEEKADVVYCNFNMYSHSSTRIEEIGCFDTDKKKLLQSYIKTVWTTIWSVLAKKELYIEHNLRSPKHICYCEDFWLAVRLMHYAEKVSYVPEAFYNYNRMNEASIVHTLNKKTEKEEQTAYLETIAFFEQEGVLQYYEKQMGWRILKSKQELVLDANRHKEFLGIYPESHHHIWDCPYINTKLKIMMWMLTHHMRVVLLPILSLRKIIGH